MKIPQKLYHATYKQLLPSIKTHGLGAKSKYAWEDSKKGVVYLAVSPDISISYAETNDNVPDAYIDNIVVLEVDTSLLDISKFDIDHNVQDNKGDTLEYQGVIQFKDTKLVQSSTEVTAKLTASSLKSFFMTAPKVDAISFYKWGKTQTGFAINIGAIWMWASADAVSINISDTMPKKQVMPLPIKLKQVEPYTLVRKVLWANLRESTWSASYEYQHFLVSYSTDAWYDFIRLNKKVSLDKVSKTIASAYRDYKSDYYNKGQSAIEDSEFDRLEELLRNLDPKNPLLKQVGSELTGETGGDKVELPVPMASLDKIKPDSIDLWLSRNKKVLVVSQKLDGISIELLYSKGRLEGAYTRGNGIVGKDVTHQAKMVRSIPQKINYNTRLIVRGELIMSESKFNNWSGEFRNARNMVAGLVNRNKQSKELKDVDFLTYEIMKSKADKSAQLKTLRQLGFSTTQYTVLRSPTISQINTYYEQYRKGRYAADGLVIELDAANRSYTSSNPSWAVAYKQGDTAVAVSTVKEVIWRVSKDGFIKPTVKFNPIELSGVSVEHATAFNGLYVYDNKIGPGTKLRITRSGDVIPYIVEVVKPTKAQMPEVKWDWNETGVDCVIKDKNSDEQHIQRILYFFQTLGAENLAQATIERLYAAGFKTLQQLLVIKTKQIAQIEGFGERKAKMIVDEIQAVITDVELPLLMSASGCFGRSFGYRRCLQLYKEYGESVIDWSGMNKGDIKQAVMQLRGFSETLAKQFADGVVAFKRWLKDLPAITIAAPRRAKSHKLKGYKFCWTGVRMPNEEAIVEQHGGEIQSSVNKDTTVLIASDPNGNSTKLDRARSLGLKILSPQQFVKFLNKMLG